MLEEKDKIEADIEIVSSPEHEEVNKETVETNENNTNTENENTNVDKAAVEGTYNPDARKRPLEQQVSFEPLVKDNLVEGLTVDQMINVERDTFKNAYKVFNRNRIIIYSVIAVLVLGILITIFLTSNKENLVWVTWTVAGISLAGLIACFVLNRHFRLDIEKKINDYLKKWAITLASSAYATNDEVKDAKISINGNVVDQDVFDAHYYAVINNIESRFRIEANYLGRAYSDCEISISCPKNTKVIGGIDPSVEQTEVEEEKVEQKADNKPTSETINALFGKLISYDLRLNNNEGIIIVFDTEKYYQPTNLKNYFKVDVEGLNEHIKVFTTGREFANKLLSDKVKEAVNQFVPDNIFTGGFISMNSHGTRIGLNLADQLMVLPIETEVPSEETLSTYKVLVDNVLNFLKVVQE